MTVVERAVAKIRSVEDPKEKTGSHDPVVGSLVNTAEVPILDPTKHRFVGERFVSIDRKALEEAGFFPEVVQARRLADQYRQIKRPLLNQIKERRAQGARDAQLIMMASALPGDGKTFTSVNLALSIARERDVTLLLVDADVAKPHISRLFGVHKEPGLLDALMDDRVDVESLVLPTDVSGLSILPAGHQDDSATELLASSRMWEIVDRLSSADRRRVILFDSPPLLLSSESRALAQVVAQIVMVVRAGGTPQRAVIEALGHLGEKPVGLILNQSQMATSDGYYGYGTYGDTPDQAAAGKTK